MTNSDRSDPPVVDRSGTLRERLTGAPGLLVGLDYDGTLAPITVDPDDATVPADTRALLRGLADREDVRLAVVSGRRLDEIQERIADESVVYAGNHGLELSSDGDRTVVESAARREEQIDSLRDAIADEVSAIPGCWIEDKGLTFTVHVRETPSGAVDRVRDAVTAAVADKSGIEHSEGKQVLEVRPTVDHDKGTALQRIARETPPDWLSLYLGDDTTDEDAFEAIQPRGIGIYVGSGETAADYRLAGQSQVENFLAWLADLELERSR